VGGSWFVGRHADRLVLLLVFLLLLVFFLLLVFLLVLLV
jgi:hypothetical protein